MECLKFNFSHPFTGRARLIACENNHVETIKIEQDEISNDLEVPLADCKNGFWRIILDWEFEGRYFSYQQQFQISAGEVLFC